MICHRRLLSCDRRKGVDVKKAKFKISFEHDSGWDNCINKFDFNLVEIIRKNKYSICIKTSLPLDEIVRILSRCSLNMSYKVKKIFF